MKVKIGLQNKIAGLKREMATQLDKDPALAALVTGEIPRSVRHLDSGAEEASSMGECCTIQFLLSHIREMTCLQSSIFAQRATGLFP